MTMQPRAFILKPLFHNLAIQNLKYLDVLTYIAIKYHDNSDKNCFPSMETISELSGLSKSFIIDSIKRLEKSKHIYVKRSWDKNNNKSYPNRYYFNEKSQLFNQIPPEILFVDDLTTNEKAILLLLREFQSAPTEIYGSIDEMAEHLGITKQTLSKQYYSLVKKGYLDKSKLKLKRTKLLQINWAYPEYLKINKGKFDKAEATLDVR